MKIRGSVVSLSFIFPHPPEDKKKTKKLEVYIGRSEGNQFMNIVCSVPGIRY